MNSFFHKIISSNINCYKFAKKGKSYLSPIQYFKLVNYPVRDVINCGAPRSGSTLLNIILSKIIFEEINTPINYYDKEDDYKKELTSSSEILLKKTHTFSYLISKRIEKGNAIGFFTHRDIRDVIVSYLQKGWINNISDFIGGNKLAFYTYDSILWAEIPQMIVIPYKKLLENKREVIRLIGEKLEVELSKTSIERIDKETSIDSSPKRNDILEFKEGAKKKYDLNTGLHKNHINNPDPGKWKNNLTKSEINLIDEKASLYLNYFNYN